MGWFIEDHYNMDGDGNFSTCSEYERAVSNGDVDKDGYDYNGNRYDSRGDRYWLTTVNTSFECVRYF